MKSPHLFLAFAFAVVSSAAPVEPLAQKWVARYNGIPNRDDFSSVVVTDAVGDIYVSGYTTDAQHSADACVIKYRGTTGERLWEWHANTPAYQEARDQPGVMPLISRLAIGPDGNPVLMAQTDVAYSGMFVRVLKLRASDGAVLWVTIPPSGAYALYALAVDSNGDVFVGGSISSRAATCKYSGLTGAMLWQRLAGQTAGYAATTIRAIRVDQTGNVAVTGLESVSGYPRAYSAKYAGSDGTVWWEQRIGTAPSYRRGRELALDASGNAIVALDDGTICKYEAATGTQLWQRQGPATPFDLIADPAGDVYVASSVYTTAASQGATLAKYAASSGTLRWTASGSFFSSLLLRGGEVLIAGQSGDDFELAAFDPANGAHRWSSYYATTLADRLTSTYRSRGRIALQPDGGVVLTGCSQGVGSGFDFATVRYAPGPALQSAAISWVLPTSARLSAQAKPNGIPATIVWQYGPTTAYGDTTPPQAISPVSNSYPGNSTYFYTYSATITGLPENSVVHARAVATSAAGTAFGDDLVFTTGWDANGDHLPDEWELAMWGNTGRRSATADDDRDGLSNLLEYAFARNPRLPDPAAALPIQRVGEYLTATITKRPHVAYLAEASGDLAGWSRAETTVISEDATTLIVRDNVSATKAPNRFLRIRVTVP